MPLPNYFISSLNQTLTVGGNDTSIQLSTIYTQDGQVVNTADFAQYGRGIITINPTSLSSVEFASFTGITPGVAPVGTLTSVLRGLSFKGNNQIPANQKFNVVGTPVIISFGTHNLLDIPALAGTNAFTGLNTFSQSPTVPDPIGGTDAANKEWVLSVVNGGPVSINQIVEAGVAGESISAGNLLYYNTSSAEWFKTSASTLTTVFNVKLGIALGAGTVGNPITTGVLTYGDLTTSGLVAGNILFSGNTAGTVSSTSGTTPRVIGIAKSTTVLYFDPYFQSRLYDYAVDAVGTDSYAVTLASAYNAYYSGMEITFKAGTANTGACSLNVNGLGAKTIKKNVSTDMATGDILANQIVTVRYDGNNFQIISNILPPISSNSGVVTTDVSSPTIIPHGLSKIPARIKLTANGGRGSSGVVQSMGTYNGIDTNTTYFKLIGVNTYTDGIDTTFGVFLLDTTGGVPSSKGTVTFDATNITITWTNSGSGISSSLLWEASIF